MRNYFLVFLMIPSLAFAQGEDKFKQFKEEWATPNAYRNAAGAPSYKYFQNRADYDMDIRIDEKTQVLYGEETITYHNNAPDALEYLWVQLDQNMRARTSETYQIQTGTMRPVMSYREIQRMLNDFDGGFKISHVKDKSGKALPNTINHTMMRIDLDKPLAPGQSYTFSIKWHYNINDRSKIGGRSGYEYFPKEDNYLYTIAQYFPRMAVYSDKEGWQNKQFLGRGEFALPFGDYSVRITVPKDHYVSATGELQNASSVLSSKERKRLEKAKTADQPVLIVTQEEAEENEKEKASGEKTWEFKAKDVRDFAFASSRKFIWDAVGVEVGGKTVMCMSFYPKEGNPLWGMYSTKVVAHTVEVYSKFTIDYPYPVAQSIHTDRIGMEYPMICFNGGRPLPDGTYSESVKYGMIGVIIHEVGHNFFPMIINSDERQWTWMDEGLNTFVQYLTETEWSDHYPSRRGPAYKIVDYMKGNKDFIRPIMTNSESIYQFGNNAYGKPATALNILRETILGRELFDFAFKTYCERWAFKHPTPEDFFRTMEDASGVDLDWFWRGWFYTTDHVDISLDEVKWYQMSTLDPDIEKPLKKETATKRQFIGDIRNDTTNSQYIEEDPTLQDFYDTWERYEANELDRKEYEDLMASLSDEQRALLREKKEFYELNFSNEGGLVMPIILEFTFEDGTKKREYLPAEIWRMNPNKVSKVFVFQQPVVSVVVDPNLETADTERSNNHWPQQVIPSRFEMYKSGKKPKGKRMNPMQRDQKSEELEKAK